MEQAYKEPEQTMNYKRQYRELSDETKQKISKANKGRPLSADHKTRISRGMLKYWENVPNKPSSGEAI